MYTALHAVSQFSCDVVSNIDSIRENNFAFIIAQCEQTLTAIVRMNLMDVDYSGLMMKTVVALMVFVYSGFKWIEI